MTWAPQGYQPIKAAAKVHGKKRLKAELAEGKRKAVVLDRRGGKLLKMPEGHWRTPKWADAILASGEMRQFPFSVNTNPVFVELLPDEKAAELTRNKGGRPESVDWGAYETLLASAIELSGYPSLENPPGWRRPADVEEWLAARLQEHGEEASHSAIKMHVRQMLLRLKKPA